MGAADAAAGLLLGLPELLDDSPVANSDCTSPCQPPLGYLFAQVLWVAFLQTRLPVPPLATVLTPLLAQLFPQSLIRYWVSITGYTCSQLLLAVLPCPWLSGICAVVEVVPGGTPFHLDGCWCRIVDFVWSFSPGLVPLSPEHPQVHLVTWLHPPWWFVLWLWNSVSLLLEYKLVYGS